jgi:hypothetical protein
MMCESGFQIENPGSIDPCVQTVHGPDARRVFGEHFAFECLPLTRMFLFLNTRDA